MERIDVNVLSSEVYEDTGVIRVINTIATLDSPECTYTLINERSFHNGIIEAEVRGHVLPDVPPFARGFAGIAFRTSADNINFDCFYVRPANGPRETDDPFRRAHATQYFYVPDRTFMYFRSHGMDQYETAADIALDEWIKLKLVIHDDTGTFFVNDMKTPVNESVGLFSGKDTRGGIGLWAGLCTEASFRNIQITYED